MKIAKKISFNKIKEIPKKLSRLPRILAVHAFLTFLVLLFFAFIIAGLVFYKYSVLAEKAKGQAEESPLQFEEVKFEKILEIWAEREKRLAGTETRTYPDPFNLPLPATSATPSPTP